MDESFYWYLVIGWVFVGATVGYLLGMMKGRADAGAVMSSFLGPIGWLLIIGGPDFRRKCKLCRAAIPDDAIRCMHCGGDIGPKPEPSSETKEPPALAKCKCNVCSQSIQFNDDGFDYRNPPSIQCPHCGMETTLYIPSEATHSNK